MQILNKNARLNSRPIRWDAHGCPSFKIGSDLSFLGRYKMSGVNFISLNVGFDLTSQGEALELIHYIKQWIQNHSDEYEIIDGITKIFECCENNKLGVAFDIEGCSLLNGNLDMVSEFYALGVRQMGFAYNNNNLFGGGCFDVDTGLTKFGEQLVHKFNDVGMVIDCSHVGYQTSMDIMNLSKYPVIFSHSNPQKIVNHPRNISDDQIISCAETGGVVGINGIGIFLGDNNISTEKIVDHVDYVVQLVGPDHVGIGLDCIFDENEVKGFVKKNSKVFPTKFGFNDVVIAQPEQFCEIGDLLAKRGYAECDINNILGENFLKVASVVWK